MSVICYDGNDTIFHLIDQNLLQGRRNLEGRAIFEIMLTQNELLFDQKKSYGSSTLGWVFFSFIT